MRYRNEVYAQSPSTKYPKKEYAQGVRPAHILFSEFLVLEDAGVLPAKLKAWDGYKGLGLRYYQMSRDFLL